MKIFYVLLSVSGFMSLLGLAYFANFVVGYPPYPSFCYFNKEDIWRPKHKLQPRYETTKSVQSYKRCNKNPNARAMKRIDVLDGKM